MRLGYNTNGFAHHDPLQALEVLAEIGYRSVAVTVDHACLNPYDPELPRQLRVFARRLEQLGLRNVIETGARYLLDPRRKHWPTLLSGQASDRARRIDFLCRAIDLASELHSDCVSLWSGTSDDDAAPESRWQRLIDSLAPVLDAADRHGVAVGFEPEPGMWIATLADFDELKRRLPHPALRLTMDVGHLHCQREFPLADQIRRHGDEIVNVHLEDMCVGVHEHLPFGEGEIDFGPVLAAFREVHYTGGLHVELSRHSHNAPTAAGTAFRFLSRWVPGE